MKKQECPNYWFQEAYEMEMILWEHSCHDLAKIGLDHMLKLMSAIIDG